jgi:hypothetical protein
MNEKDAIGLAQNQGWTEADAERALQGLDWDMADEWDFMPYRVQKAFIV